MSIPYYYFTRQLDLGFVLYRIFKESTPPRYSAIPIGHSYQVFYYCSESEYYVFGGMYPFENYLLLDKEFVDRTVISVRIIRIHPPLEAET